MRVVVFVYLCFVLLAAAYFKKRGKGFTEYVLADRSLGVFLSTVGLLGSYVGGGTLLAVVGHVAKNGLADIWMFFGAILSFVILGLVGKDLRKSNAFTLPHYIGQHFGRTAQSALLPFVLLAVCGFLGVQLGAATLVLSKALGFQQLHVLVFIIFFVTAYTWIGGMMADTVTDSLQFGVIFAGLVISVLFLSSGLEAKEPILNMMKGLDDGEFLSLTRHGWPTTIGLILVLPLIVITSPTYHQRIYSTKDHKTASSSGFLAALAYVFVAALIMLTGILGRITFPGIESYDNIIPLVIKSSLSPIMAGIVLAALLGAVMSSIDSHLLTASTIISVHSVYKLDRGNARDPSSGLARLLVVIFAVIGTGLAALSGSLFQLLGGTWVLLVATASGPVIYAAKKVNLNHKGIALSITVGGIGTLIALFYGIQPEILALPCAAWSFLLPLIVTAIKKPTTTQTQKAGVSP